MDIRGECRAGATCQTTRYPIRPARPNVKTLVINRGPATLPSATVVPMPAVTVATSRIAFCHGVIALVFFSASAAFVGVGGGTGVAGATRGTDSDTAPWCTTRAPWTTSSSKLICKRKGVFTGPIERSFVILFE